MMRVGLLCAVVLQAVCGQRSFKLITNKLSWFDARDFCQTNYENLADVENLMELASLVTTVNLGGAWIGLYYDSNASSPRWSTGATYDWMPNVSSLSTGKCGILLFMMSMPSSATCSLKNAFICMYHGPSKVTLTAPVIEGGGAINQPGAILASFPGGGTAVSGGGNVLASFTNVTNLTTRALIVEETVLPLYGTVGAIEPMTTNRPQDAKGTGYLVMKVNFFSVVPKNPERTKTLLLTQVQELLEGRLPKDSFQLKWVGYENLS